MNMAFATPLEFQKVEFEPTRSTGADYVRLKDYRVTISTKLVRALNWKAGDRVDLLQSGNVFAFERNPVGVFYLKPTNKDSYTLNIHSTKLASHIRAFVGEDGIMEAFTDGRKVIFRKV
jgi:hypothetical protein